MLGPLLFLLYTAELFGDGATSHFYADDGQLYLAADAEEVAIRLVVACVADVDA